MGLSIEDLELSKFIMVGDRVLIKPKTPQGKTKSGLYLPPGVQEKEKIHITEGTIRLSVGIEDSDDLIADLDGALGKI